MESSVEGQWCQALPWQNPPQTLNRLVGPPQQGMKSPISIASGGLAGETGGLGPMLLNHSQGVVLAQPLNLLLVLLWIERARRPEHMPAGGQQHHGVSGNLPLLLSKHTSIGPIHSMPSLWPAWQHR